MSVEIQEAPTSPCSRLTCTPPFFAPSLGVSLFCLAASVSPAYHLTIPAWCVLVLGHLCSHLRFLLTLISRDFWSFHPGLSHEPSIKVSSVLVLLWHFHEVEARGAEEEAEEEIRAFGGGMSCPRSEGPGLGRDPPGLLFSCSCSVQPLVPSLVRLCFLFSLNGQVWGEASSKNF